MRGPEIFIISKNGESRENLLGSLSVLKNEFKNMKIEGLGASEENPSFSPNTKGLVIDTDQSPETLFQSVQEYRSRGFNEPILILGRYDVAELSNAPGSQLRVTYLSKPYKESQLVNAVREMVFNPIISARRHTRFDKNLRAEVKIKEELAACHVKNMSKGGAYIELLKARSVKVGDEVVLRLKLDKSEVTYDLVSRVAWLDYESGGFGIEFGKIFDEALAA